LIEPFSLDGQVRNTGAPQSAFVSPHASERAQQNRDVFVNWSAIVRAIDQTSYPRGNLLRVALVGGKAARTRFSISVCAFVFGYLAARLGYGLMWTALSLILLMGFALSVKLEEARQYVRNEVASS